MRNEATIKQIIRNKKFSLVLSIMARDTISHRISLEIFTARNFMPASGLPYKYLLNIIYTRVLKNNTKNTTMKLSWKFILQN